MNRNVKSLVVSILITISIVLVSIPLWRVAQGKDIGSVCDMNVSAFVRKCKQLGFDNNNVFELFDKYGSYIAGCQINIDSINIIIII